MRFPGSTGGPTCGHNKALSRGVVSCHVCPWSASCAPLVTWNRGFPFAESGGRSEIPPRPACRLFSFGATMPAMRILIIEDDRQAASYLVKAFAKPATSQHSRRARRATFGICTPFQLDTVTPRCRRAAIAPKAATAGSSARAQLSKAVRQVRCSVREAEFAAAGTGVLTH